MKQTPFLAWIQEVGPVEAARRISEIEEARGRPALTYQAIQDWTRKTVPAERVPAVEADSGISRFLLRPDVFGEAVA